MDVNQATDILWQSMQQGDHAPEALRKTLSLSEAYQVQLGILDRLVAGGGETEWLEDWRNVGCGAPNAQADGAGTGLSAGQEPLSEWTEV